MEQKANSELRRALDEGIASAMLEGYSPRPEFRQDCDAISDGALTFEQARCNALERALRCKKSENSTPTACVVTEQFC
jgi:hypothetical protein